LIRTAPIDTRGWSYEGFFFEAQDESGAPFIAVYNFWRGQHKGGRPVGPKRIALSVPARMT
jgi:hypothetical protein